jgi:hypothetical protein
MSTKLNKKNYEPTKYDDFVVPSSVSSGQAADDCPDDIETPVPENSSQETLDVMVKSYTSNGYEVKLERDPTQPDRVLKIVAKRIKDLPKEDPVLVRSAAVDITTNCSSCKKTKPVKEFSKKEDSIKKYKTCLGCREKTSRSDSKKEKLSPIPEEEKKEEKKEKRKLETKKGSRKKQKQTGEIKAVDLLTDEEKNFSFIKQEPRVVDPLSA